MKRYYLIFAFMSFVLQKILGEEQQTLIRLVSFNQVSEMILYQCGLPNHERNKKGKHDLIESFDAIVIKLFRFFISHKMQLPNYKKISRF